MGSFAKEALKLFYQKFGRRIIKTAAESKWMANTIRLLKQKAHKPKTSDVAQRVREKMLKDKLQGKPYIDKQGRSWGFQKVPHPKGPAKIIPFPKKPPGKADGGRIDKALPKRSRDI